MIKGKANKILLTFLAAILALELTACSSSDDSNKREVSRREKRADISSSDETDSSVETNLSSDSSPYDDNYSLDDTNGETIVKEDINPDSITIEEQVLIEQDGLKVTAKEYVYDKYSGPGIDLLIENDSDQDILLSTTSVIVNDYMVTSYFSEEVNAGKKSNDTMYFSETDLETAGIDTIGKVEIYFHISDPDTYKKIEDFECVTIETSAQDSIETSSADIGTEIYVSDYVSISAICIKENTIGGMELLLYIENKTDQNITVCCDDLSINGYMITGYFSADVYNGKKAYDSISFSSSDMEENGLTDINDIDDIEVAFRVRDADFKVIEETEPIQVFSR